MSCSHLQRSVIWSSPFSDGEPEGWRCTACGYEEKYPGLSARPWRQALIVWLLLFVAFLMMGSLYFLLRGHYGS